MIVLLQRVLRAEVTVLEDASERSVGRTEGGLLAFVCAEPGDTEAVIAKAARKTARLRVFEDEAGKMNRSILDAGGSVLAVSQFTLAADCLSGNRPGFSAAAAPSEGFEAFKRYVELLRNEGLSVETGEFGAHMRVSLVNDGPATFWLTVR